MLKKPNIPYCFNYFQLGAVDYTEYMFHLKINLYVGSIYLKMEHIFVSLKQCLTEHKQQVLAYIDGFNSCNTSYDRKDSAIVAAYFRGRKDAGFIAPNDKGRYHLYKLKIGYKEINECFIESYDGCYEEIADLYEFITYTLGLSEQQFEEWIYKQEDYVTDLSDAYNHYPSYAWFATEIDRKTYSMGYGKFMKIMKRYLKSRQIFEVEKHQKSKISFKRKQDETKLINHAEPKSIYRDNGWIEGSNVEFYDICEHVKKLKV
jgi:hypothetical protein